MSAGARKYPYRHYPATPARNSEATMGFLLVLIMLVFIGLALGYAVLGA